MEDTQSNETIEFQKHKKQIVNSLKAVFGDAKVEVKQDGQYDHTINLDGASVGLTSEHNKVTWHWGIDVCHRGGHMEPDHYEFDERGSSGDHNDAIKGMIQLVTKIRMDAYHLYVDEQKNADYERAWHFENDIDSGRYSNGVNGAHMFKSEVLAHIRNNVSEEEELSAELAKVCTENLELVEGKPCLTKAVMGKIVKILIEERPRF